jgi:hypothetical protein
MKSSYSLRRPRFGTAGYLRIAGVRIKKSRIPFLLFLLDITQKS